MRSVFTMDFHPDANKHSWDSQNELSFQNFDTLSFELQKQLLREVYQPNGN